MKIRPLLLLCAAAAILCACTAQPLTTLPAPTAEQLLEPSVPASITVTATEPICTEPPVAEAPTTEAPLPPVFGQTPELCDTTLVINGKALPAAYIREDTCYACLSDLSQALDAFYLQIIGEGSDHSCILRLPHRTLFLATNSDYASDEQTRVSLGGTPVFDGEDWFVPIDDLLHDLGYSVLQDTENDTVYYTAYPCADSLPAGKDIPVLMYHAVSDCCWGTAELFVSPSVLDAQIAALLDAGYTLITFEDFDRLFEIEKPVMLTFDDGYDDNYDYLFPILQKYQVKATVFMIVNDIGKNHKLTKEELIEMSDSGLVSIQSHTMSHNYLSYMNDDQLDRELWQSKLALTRLTGKEPFVLCYPTGMYSERSLKKTAEYYEFGLLMSKGLYTTGSDPYKIHRFYVPRGLTAEGLLQKIG